MDYESGFNDIIYTLFLALIWVEIHDLLREALWDVSVALTYPRRLLSQIAPLCTLYCRTTLLPCTVLLGLLTCCRQRISKKCGIRDIYKTLFPHRLTYVVFLFTTFVWSFRNTFMVRESGT